ncbi:MAG: hypothetical protein HYV40_01345 [Candidatus Levybacteria bacterium]|nr:hypothetical protein [Candidatus Levybacteria bacterium]
MTRNKIEEEVVKGGYLDISDSELESLRRDLHLSLSPEQLKKVGKPSFVIGFRIQSTLSWIQPMKGEQESPVYSAVADAVYELYPYEDADKMSGDSISALQGVAAVMLAFDSTISKVLLESLVGDDLDAFSEGLLRNAQFPENANIAKLINEMAPQLSPSGLLSTDAFKKGAVAMWSGLNEVKDQLRRSTAQPTQTYSAS